MYLTVRSRDANYLPMYFAWDIFCRFFNRSKFVLYLLFCKGFYSLNFMFQKEILNSSLLAKTEGLLSQL